MFRGTVITTMSWYVVAQESLKRAGTEDIGPQGGTPPGLARRHQKEVAELKQQLEMEKERVRSWQTNCEHLAEEDATITAQEEELAVLRKQISEL